MKVLVLGSTGGSGRAAVTHLLQAGHEVTAFSRRQDAFSEAPRLRIFEGNAMHPADIERAVKGQDAVVVTLGISENPLWVRLFGAARTPLDIRSTGTQHAIAAMKKHGLRRLVVQTTYGVGATRTQLRFIDRLFFKLLLKPQIEDTEIQNQMVIESGLDWVLVQPVHLTNGPESDAPFISTHGETGKMSVSRQSVGRFLAEAVEKRAFVGQSVSLSGALPKTLPDSAPDYT